MTMEPKSCETGLDRISELPERIIHQILCALPIKDACRTSTLSSKWRYIWKTIPDLVFNDEVANTMYKLVNIVDHILLLRHAPIRKFEMKHQSLEDVYDFNRLIFGLSETPLEEFILESFRWTTYYKLPSCIFDFKNLIRLRLESVELKLPTTFEGLHKLKILYLSNSTMFQDEFETLIAKCPLLESLTLSYLNGFYCLNIEAPNLQTLDVEGSFDVIHLRNTFQLTSVDIGLTEKPEGYQLMACQKSSDLPGFFDNLPQLQSLVIQGYFLKYLAILLQISTSLSTACKNLTYLSVCVDFSDTEEISTMLCLLKSSPNLEQVEITNDDGLNKVGRSGHAAGRQIDRANYEYPKMIFGELRFVEIMQISEDNRVIEFINFLLSNSPILKRMTVRPSANCGEEQQIDLLKVLLRFQQLSKAEVVYLDP